MNSIIRLLGVANRTPPLSPMRALEDILDLLAGEDRADIVLLPRLCLCPPSAGELLRSKTVRAACEEAFSGLLLRSQELEGYLVTTALFWDSGTPLEESVVIYKGECYRIHPGEKPLFKLEDLHFLVLPCPPDSLAKEIPGIIESGCELVLCPCYEPVYAGAARRWEQSLCCISSTTGCAVMMVNGGVGDTSCPDLYGGMILMADGGRITAQKRASMESIALCYDVDCDTITPLRQHPGTLPVWEHPCNSSKAGLYRPLSRTPYLPDDDAERAEYLDEVFHYQCRALATRLDNSGIGRMVVGVSGGLDSTLALLCCAGACDLLGIPRENVLGVTMPGFGTCDRTYFNALQLMEQLGVETRDIPISGAVSSHFEDIGHNPAVRDVTYENAQARERAQILFDLANSCGGLVVGTGDLSEAALGFSTFGGDHLAGYNVNICLNKTTIRALVGRIAESPSGEGVSETLRDILDTPVSPELLPPDESGNPLQKSEEILGPYLLHDFFLHYTLLYQFTPQKVSGYAAATFAGEYEPEFIREKLKIFLRRFYASQFKRSCSPDCARIVRPNLYGYAIPSDMDAQLFLEGL